MTIFDVLKKSNIGFWDVVSKNSITKETKQNYAKAGAKSNKWLKISRIVGAAWPNGNIVAITNKIYQCGCTWTAVNKIVKTLNPPNHYKNRKIITTKLFDAKMCPQTTQPVKNRLSKTEKKNNPSTNIGLDSTGSDSSNDSGSGGSDDESSTDSDTSSTADNNNLTYDDILHSIASAIDAHYYIVDDVLYFNSFNVLFSGSKYKTGFPEIPVIVDYWMQEDGSLEFDVNQYGMYNTVVMEYKYGKLEVSNEDLVRVYGRVPITYKDKSLGYYDARLKAEAFLSAHIRDFGMEVKVSTLYTAKIKVGSFIKLRNPLTMSESLYYVYGMSVSYDAGENTFVADLDLRYGPENPDDPEVPEIGTAGYKKSAEADKDCWKKWWEFAYKSFWSMNYNVSDGNDPKACYNYYKNQKGTKQWDCFTSSSFLYYVLNFLCKVPTRVVVAYSNYSSSGTHRCVQCKINGKWKFPSEYDNMDKDLKVSGPMRSGNFKIFRKEPSDLNNPKSYPNRIPGLI